MSEWIIKWVFKVDWRLNVFPHSLQLYRRQTTAAGELGGLTREADVTSEVDVACVACVISISQPTLVSGDGTFKNVLVYLGKCMDFIWLSVLD